jgi:hypothetical protein
VIHDKAYLDRLPERVPEDQVLVHNRVWPRIALNANGFRAWLQSPADYLEVCNCGWAPQLGEHFTTKIR